MGLNERETEITYQSTTGIIDDRLAKFYPEHLRTWVYEEKKRLNLVRHWIAEAAMDATGLPVAGKYWSVVEHDMKGIKH